MWEPTILAALIAAAVGLLTPWVAGKVRAHFQGRIQESEAEWRGREKFYDDLQARLAAVQAQLDEALAVNMEFRHQQVEWERERNEMRSRMDAIAADIRDMRALLQDLADHPQGQAAVELAVKVLDRVRSGRDVANG